VGRDNPYVGPRALVAGERLFGRDREVADLTDLVIAERVVLLYAPSGAGKTSLLQAGLVPRLRAEGLAVRPVARVSLPPAAAAGNRFVASVLLGLEEDVPKDRQVPLAELSRRSLAGYLDARGGDDVLVVDQLEEVLTIDPAGVAEKQAFFAELGAALRRRDRYAVLAMREDWLAALDPYRGRVPTRLRAMFRLAPLGPAAALAAVQGPARACGVEFGDAAAGKLVDDLRQIRTPQPDGTVLAAPGPSVEPVQLQVACRSLWARLPGDAREIRAQDLAAIGDVDRALAAYFDDELAAAARAGAAPERLLRSWLARHLVTEAGLRSQVLRTPGATLGLDDRALAALVDAHLVRAEARRGMQWLELAHDRLVAPLRASNERWAAANVGPALQQAELWDRQGRPDHLLLADDAALAEAAGGGSTPAEAAFFAASERARARRARERRLAVFVRVLAAAACAGLVAAVVMMLRARASAAAERAASAEADAARGRAEAALAATRRAERVALARQLAAEILNMPADEVARAALLAVAASELAPEDEPRQALLGLQGRWPRLLGVLGGEEVVSGLARDPVDGAIVVADERGLRRLGAGAWARAAVVSTAPAFAAEWLAVGEGAERVGVYARASGAPAGAVDRPLGDEGVSAVALGPDGATVVVGGSAGTVVGVDWRGGAERWRIGGRGAAVQALWVDDGGLTRVDVGGVVRFDRARRQVAEVALPVEQVAAGPGWLVVASRGADLTDPRVVYARVDPVAGTWRALWEEAVTAVSALTVRPDGREIAAVRCFDHGCAASELLVLSAEGEGRLAVPLMAGRPAAVYAADGETVVVAAYAAAMQRVDVRPPATLPADVTAAAVFADGARVAVAGADTGLGVWSLAPLRRLDRLASPLDATQVALVAGEAQAAVVEDGGRVQVWDLAARALLHDTRAPEPVVQATAVARADGALWAAAATLAGELVVWDARTGAALRRVGASDDPGGVTPPAWRPGGAGLASAVCVARDSSCREARLWTWDLVAAPARAAWGVPGRVEALSFRADGGALVGAASGGLARWDGAGAPVYERDGRTGFDSVAHAPDGRWLAAAGGCNLAVCSGGAAQLRDAATLRALGLPLVDPLATSTQVLAVAPEHVVLRSNLDVRVWDVGLARLRRSACELAGRTMTADERARYLGAHAELRVCE
jgi:hypothetical protein